MVWLGAKSVGFIIILGPINACSNFFYFEAMNN